MASFTVINDIFQYCAKKHLHFEMNLEEDVIKIIYESDKKKVTLFLCNQKDEKTEKFIIEEFEKLKQLID